MEYNVKTVYLISALVLLGFTCESAKINTPRVLLPWFENFVVNFTFEIIEGGCYTWGLSRNDIIVLEPLYEDTWGHCSRAARVSVSKSCVPPGSVIILAEEVNSGEILRGDVDVNTITSLKVMSTTWKLYLEEAPEAFEVVASDNQGNTFSTLEGVTFTWKVENVDKSIEEPLVTLVRWKETDYEAPRGVTELEDLNRKSYSVLLYGQAMGEARVTVCLERRDICAVISLHVVASVVLTPAVAIIARGDTVRYKVVRARAGRLTIQDLIDTVYYMKLPDSSDIAVLEDSVSLVRGTTIGSTSVSLLSGPTEVAMATLTVVDPHSIKVTLRPSELAVRGEPFNIHCIVLDVEGRALTAGDEIVIALSVDGEALVDITQSNINGTQAEAVAQSIGNFVVTAVLRHVGGRKPAKRVEGQTTGKSVEPLEVIPPVMYISYTDSVQDIQLSHRGGGGSPVSWGSGESEREESLSLSASGVLTVRGEGDTDVTVHLNKYPHVRATGRVIATSPEYLQVTSSGQARVGNPHHIHVSLSGVHPNSGEFFTFHKCNCASLSTSLLEGPELLNISSAHNIEPIEGACCVLQAVWGSRGNAILRIKSERAEDMCRVRVRAAPQLVWPTHAAALVGATIPVLGLGESLFPSSEDPRISELMLRDGPAPHKHTDLQLFTLHCNKKGDTNVRLTSQAGDESELVELEVACAGHVTRIRLEPPAAPGNCSAGPKLWLRPGNEIKVKVTLLDAIGRELLNERGPKVKWEVNPGHRGIEFRALDRLLIETHPEYIPVPVPYKYYQIIMTEEKAVGWSGTISATIPDATANIQARVVAPLLCDSLLVNMAWESELVSKIVQVSGGSGKYAVETPKGVTGNIDGGYLNAVVPGPGVYDFVVIDQCIGTEKQYVEVHIEEVISVEVSTSRAICVGGCVPISALVIGPSRRYLSTNGRPEWRVAGPVEVRGDQLCGTKEGAGRIRASYSGVWSNQLEVLVFPPLSIVPSRVRLPIGGKLQLRHVGGPPSHLATLYYETVDGMHNLEITSSGSIAGVALGAARVRLVARDGAGLEMAAAQADVEVVPISGVSVAAATQTLLVGRPAPLWLEAEGLTPGLLAGVQPTPRVTWTLRDQTAARLVTTHADDHLERSTAEGMSVRVIPLKAGLITVDVKVRRLGKISESRSWESSIEILAINDIRTGIEGHPTEFIPGDRLAIAVGSMVRLKSVPRGNWRGYSDEGVLELTSGGEIKGLKPGHGVVVVMHKDEKNKVYRETTIHVEVAVPHYCTAEPSGDLDENAVRLVMRNNVGREILAPDATISAHPPLPMHLRRNAHSSLGSELVFTGLDSVGSFMTFQGTTGGVTVKDEVWVTGSDGHSDRITATGGWVICLEGVGWRAPPGLAVWERAGGTLVVLGGDTPGRHSLQGGGHYTLLQLPVHKIEFLPGDWPSSMVPLTITANGLTNGPILCTEEQKLSLLGADIELPIVCKTEAPHTAQAVLDLNIGQMGCSILPANQITEATEVELCAEFGTLKTCTRIFILPVIFVKPTKISLIEQPSKFTIYGHPHALKLVKITTSPGLKMELNLKLEGEITVLITSEVDSCGFGWVNVVSKLTGQEMRVDVERECDQTCGTLLAAIFSFLRPYMATLITVAAIAGGSVYLYARITQKSSLGLPSASTESVLPPRPSPRTCSRSPYHSNGPVTPIYGDTSMIPDTHFSPNSSRTHSRFL